MNCFIILISCCWWWWLIVMGFVLNEWKRMTIKSRERITKQFESTQLQMNEWRMWWIVSDNPSFLECAMCVLEWRRNHSPQNKFRIRLLWLWCLIREHQPTPFFLSHQYCYSWNVIRWWTITVSNHKLTLKSNWVRVELIFSASDNEHAPASPILFLMECDMMMNNHNLKS